MSGQQGPAQADVPGFHRALRTIHRNVYTGQQFEGQLRKRGGRAMVLLQPLSRCCSRLTAPHLQIDGSSALLRLHSRAERHPQLVHVLQPDCHRFSTSAGVLCDQGRLECQHTTVQRNMKGSAGTLVTCPPPPAAKWGQSPVTQAHRTTIIIDVSYEMEAVRWGSQGTEGGGGAVPTRVQRNVMRTIERFFRKASHALAVHTANLGDAVQQRGAATPVVYSSWRPRL